MANTGFRYTQNDFDGDAKTVTWDCSDITIAGGFAAWQTAMNTLQAQMALWAVGREQRVEHIVIIEDNGPGKATSPIAQGALRLIVEGADALTGVVYRFPLPMPDMGKAAGGGEPAWIAVGQGQNSLTQMNPLHPDYATFKTAFETICKSPAGNAVDMVRGYIEE